MVEQALLRGAAVVRRHDEEAISASSGSLARQVHRMRRVVRADARDDTGAVTDSLLDCADDRGLFVISGRRRLARRAVDHEAVVAEVIDEVLRKSLRAGDIQ